MLPKIAWEVAYQLSRKIQYMVDILFISLLLQEFYVSLLWLNYLSEKEVGLLFRVK